MKLNLEEISSQIEGHTLAFTSAFLLMSVSTTSRCPLSTAQCKGVLPSLSAEGSWEHQAAERVKKVRREQGGNDKTSDMARQ